jgi:8-oxo-dGTP pyrophosphatase MutT (NUDIX family)/GNAT superfamily N-acetyltransferase
VAGLGEPVWLHGGWAVDALVGEQTRPHADVDIAVATADLPGLARRLVALGWAPVGPALPGRVSLRTPEGLVVDLQGPGAGSVTGLSGAGTPAGLADGGTSEVRIGASTVPVPHARSLLAERATRELDETTVHDLLQLGRVAPTVGGPALREDGVTLVSVPSERDDVVLFAAHAGGVRVGAGLLTVHGDEGRVAVSVEPARRRAGLGTAIARGLVRYAFDTLGLRRLQARHQLGDFPAERLGVRAGFRREGVARGASVPGGRADVAVLARLPSDVDPARDTLLAHLTTVAAARLAASLLVRDTLGRVLLVEPTYKPRWDLPGGSVEAGESPRAAAGREGREELGVDLPVGALLAVDWLGGPAGHGDGMFFLFDGGVVDAERFLTELRLPPDELRAARFVDPQEAPAMLNPRLAARLAGALSAVGTGQTAYLELGLPPGRPDRP